MYEGKVEEVWKTWKEKKKTKEKKFDSIRVIFCSLGSCGNRETFMEPAYSYLH